MIKLVKIEIDKERLGMLIASGQLCVADIRSLDQASKKILWKLCLRIGSKRLRCEQYLFNEQAEWQFIKRIAMV
ncbi:hypothetical protein L5M38_13720 [Shewanella sp. SM101]|uniref:Uncharacterized protein n=1 Tax=Shewanella putrefaciens (strain 200) TaxID=399804 RepID=E6XJM5_SHEP2|nr:MULTISPECIES: hypothetical protein [unclassified Shewanella]MCU8032244.1 hypothetical protein [Shewanella sp. SM73]MCU8105583.1 hypothetical protein [Shewanella sp. SM101]